MANPGSPADRRRFESSPPKSYTKGRGVLLYSNGAGGGRSRSRPTHRCFALAALAMIFTASDERQAQL